MNDDLLELQTQLSYQDDVVQQLNEVVTRQQGEIDLMRREMDIIKARMKELISTQGDGNETVAVDVPPPHY